WRGAAGPGHGSPRVPLPPERAISPAPAGDRRRAARSSRRRVGPAHLRPPPAPNGGDRRPNAGRGDRLQRRSAAPRPSPRHAHRGGVGRGRAFVARTRASAALDGRRATRTQTTGGVTRSHAHAPLFVDRRGTRTWRCLRFAPFPLRVDASALVVMLA